MSAEPQQKRDVCAFGEFRIEASERRLWRGNEPIPLKPKQFDLLLFFAENAQRTVRKDELLAAVWPDSYVDESTLARNVSWLRALLDDSGDGKKIIETVPKVGYRFTAEVSVLQAKPSEMSVIDEETVRYARAEQTITIPDREVTQNVSFRNTRRFPPRSVAFFSAVLVFAALAGISSISYWKDFRIGARSSESNRNAKTSVKTVEIDVARPTFDSRIDIKRSDRITFSVSGEFKFESGQTWTFEGDEAADVSTDYIYEKAAPWSLVGWVGAENDQSRYFQVSKIHSITADRNGSLYFAVNKPKNQYFKNSGTLVADVTVGRYAANERPRIEIGSVINLQNRHPNVGGYLDAWGSVWSRPEFNKITTEEMFVSTHHNPNRDNGSGSWEIISADGKSSGEPLVVGDRIHLRNKFPDAGYLDGCGWVEHLPVFKDFSDQTAAVFTTKSPNRDYGTGTWIIRSASESDGSPILEGDSIALENGFLVVVMGRSYRVGFLNVTGSVKEVPAYSDYDGASLVFGQDRSSDEPVLDIWTITLSRAALK